MCTHRARLHRDSVSIQYLNNRRRSVTGRLASGRPVSERVAKLMPPRQAPRGLTRLTPFWITGPDPNRAFRAI
ncbi:hypothetical protein J6590_005718 [Homalodisca vitripennis]|nr:hypothetical protein J6590_005718 [Homalodisca vitripennis]